MLGYSHAIGRCDGTLAQARESFRFIRDQGAEYLVSISFEAIVRSEEIVTYLQRRHALAIVVCDALEASSSLDIRYRPV